MSEVSITVCAYVCMCWCMCVHMLMHEMCLEMPKVRTICARHGIWEQSDLNTSKTCETSSIKVNSSKGTHLSPIQPKNVTWTFCQTLDMQQFINTIKNVWTWWNMPQYNFKLPHRASTDTQTSNGIKPHKILEKYSQKLRTPTCFRKIPNFENPN